MEKPLCRIILLSEKNVYYYISEKVKAAYPSKNREFYVITWADEWIIHSIGIYLVPNPFLVLFSALRVQLWTEPSPHLQEALTGTDNGSGIRYLEESPGRTRCRGWGEQGKPLTQQASRDPRKLWPSWAGDPGRWGMDAEAEGAAGLSMEQRWGWYSNRSAQGQEGWQGRLWWGLCRQRVGLALPQCLSALVQVSEESLSQLCAGNRLGGPVVRKFTM